MSNEELKAKIVKIAQVNILIQTKLFTNKIKLINKNFTF